MNARSLVLALALLVGACTTMAPPPPGSVIPGFLAAAVNDPARPTADRERDIDRKPAEVLAFAGLTPGMKVADLIPGGGYFTRIFSRAVGPTGKVYAYVPDELTKLAKRDPAVKAVVDDPAYHGNTAMIVRRLPDFGAPEKLDLVWTSLNYHDMHADFMGPVDVAAVNKAVFNSLRPGGIYIVIDHVDDIGTGISHVNNLHRIDPSVVRREVEAAGFVFDGESTILRNPLDTHKLAVFDESIRGHTDQFVYKFRKPRGAR
ncbi:MAG TPA: class I SAM-dependent methyltransferase [Caulobacteraceae bacterium]